jgi:Fe-S oxidoreductase
LNPQPHTAEFWDAKALDAETLRVYDICHQCRRCYNLCPSFGDLFQMIDTRGEEGDVSRLTAEDKKKVVDECYECRLCYNHCPYTPPHDWNLDFPLLMLRSKAAAAREGGGRFRDRLLAKTELIGRLGSALAPIFNWANRNRVNRVLMEKTVGIHRDRLLPIYQGETFARWFAGRQPSAGAGEDGEVTLFPTCSVNYSSTAVGKAAVTVLEHNGIRVHCPEPSCCGMPSLDSGNLEEARQMVQSTKRLLAGAVAAGRPIVVPGPSCSLMMKQEYPRLDPGPESERLARLTLDLCEYLAGMRKEEKLKTDFKNPPGSILYQAPCHLRAQNIGFKSMELLRAIPGAQVTLVERCSAMDGTWGMKKENFELSLQTAEPLFREVRQAKADWIASDCPLSGIQIEQGTGHRVLHPIQILMEAYGLKP